MKQKYEENEDTVMWREYRKDKQERHLNNKVKNMEILNSKLKDITFNSPSDECLTFRDERYPKVNFYPSTGRWMNATKCGRVYSGGADRFINWYLSHKLD